MALLAAIFGLDAQYYETAAATSAKVYTRIQRLRSGGGLGLSMEFTRKKGKRSSLPMLPWLGGAGPIAWRQLTSAQRDFFRTLLVPFVLCMMTLPALFAASSPTVPMRDPIPLALGLQAMVLGSTFFLSSIVPFDFRSDFDRLPEMKALPLSAMAIVMGQIATPVFVMTASQAFVMALIGFKLTDASWAWMFAVFAAFAAPLNIFQIGIENLFFLLYPTRPMAGGGTFDVQAMGRVMILLFIKFLIVGCAAGVAVGSGFLFYYLFGQSLVVGYGGSLLVMTALSCVPLPFAAWAFARLDVARDVPR